MNSEITKPEGIVNRSIVERKRNYLHHREMLRHDFWYSCAYCSITEVEAGGIGFEIDHYLPQKHRPELKNDYNNLMWSCQKCNRYKGDHNPDQDDILNSRVIIKVDKEDPDDHLIQRDCFLEGKTAKGDFNIIWLFLNRLNLRRLRDIRQKFWAAHREFTSAVTDLLGFRIDRLPAAERANAIELQQYVKNRSYELSTYVVEVIRELGRSPMLDEDPKKKKHLAKRRRYLKEQRAITVDASVVKK